MRRSSTSAAIAVAVSLAALGPALGGCSTTPTSAALSADHPLNVAYAHVQAVRVSREEAFATATERPAERALRQSLTGLLSAPGGKAPSIARPTIKQADGYREMKASFSADTVSQRAVIDADDWVAGFRAACAKMGGALSDKFCSATADHDTVLFMAVVKTQYYPNWNRATEHDVMLVEPTVQPSAPQFRRLLEASGFLSKAALDDKTRLAEAAAADRLARERARLKADWPRMQVRGQMVCQDQAGVRYVGYVEDFTDERMKISVARALLGSSGFSPGNFQPSVVWTRPEGWFPCDSTGAKAP